MRLLLIQGEALKEGFNWLSIVIGGGVGLAAFFVAWIYFRSGLEEKLTIKYKALWEAEKADNERLIRERQTAQTEREEARKRAEQAETERRDLLEEYTQLTQLFATKSVILEKITGIYSRIAENLQAGSPDSLAALGRFLSPRGSAQDDIHKTNPGGGG